MNERDLKLIAGRGENPLVEFSKCSTELTDSVFQSICSFLNREGGSIIVGIHEYGKIVGIVDIFLDSMLSKFEQVMEREISPSFPIRPEVVSVDGQTLIYISIPSSPNVHRFKNKVYDRCGSEVMDITYNYGLVENLYLRKRLESSESIVCPFLKPSEFDGAAFATMRKAIAAINPGHHWLNLSDEAILHKEGFWKKDLVTQKEGYTLAAVLLFGKEVTIQNYCPVTYRIEAIYRNIPYESFAQPASDYPESKYDDRDIIFSNLIETYPRLVKFLQRHIPERGNAGGGSRSDMLEPLLNPIVSNLLIHRDYTHKQPSRILLFSDRLITENGSSYGSNSKISLADLEKQPKNPLIYKIFEAMNWTGVPASGKETIIKHASSFDRNGKIEIHDGEIFSFSMTYSRGIKSENTNPSPRPQPVFETPDYAVKYLRACPTLDISYVDKAEAILEVCVKPQQIQDMMRLVRQSNRTRFRQNILRPLIEYGYLSMRIPSKPSSPLQRYFTTSKGIALLEEPSHTTPV
jgi:ATP-dependent DNA helicase RecG